MNTPATIHINGWGGLRALPCRVVGETPERYRVEVDEPTLLPAGLLQPGQVALVPKTAVKLATPPPETVVHRVKSDFFTVSYAPPADTARWQPHEVLLTPTGFMVDLTPDWVEPILFHTQWDGRRWTPAEIVTPDGVRHTFERVD